MALFERMSEMLEAEEGKRASVYQDSLGYWTIGVGICVDERKGCGLRDHEIKYLLLSRINEVRNAARAKYEWFDRLNETRQCVVLGMMFQLGEEGFDGFYTTRKLIAAGDYIGAAEQMLKSKWATQTPQRAHRAAERMRTGEW